MELNQIKPGMTIYYLDRDSYNPDEEIIKCLVYEKNGKIRAKSTDRTIPFDFEITKNFTPGLYLFPTREAAEAKIQEEFKEWKEKIESQPKKEFVKMLFDRWYGEYPRPEREAEVMKNKFKKEFGIEF